MNLKTIKNTDKLLQRISSRKQACTQRTEIFRNHSAALLKLLRLTPDHLDKYDGRQALQSMYGGMGDFGEGDNELDDSEAIKGNNKRVDGLNIPMLNTQINECVSELSSLLLNYSDAFAAYGSPAYQVHIEAFSNRMTDDFKNFNHYVQFVKAFKYLLYYNRAVVHHFWRTGSEFSGVSITTHNPENAFISVPDDDGDIDFALLVSRVTKESMVNQYVELTDSKGDLTFSDSNPFSYAYVPSNIDSFGGRTELDKQDSKYYCNRYVTYIKSRPEVLFDTLPEGLISLATYLFRVTYINDVLVSIEVSTDLTMPVVDVQMVDGASSAEQLLPVQRYINFMGGMKKAADRKRVFGINIYDRNAVTLEDIEAARAADAVSPYIPSTVPEGKTLRDAIVHFNDAPDTQNVVGDILQLKSIMQTVLPTDFATRMGSLDRATEYQAKRAMEQSTKLSRLFAILINQILVSPMKRIHIKLLFGNETEINVVNEQGALVPTKIDEFRDKNITGSITTAITGIDRDIKAEQLESFLNKLVQMPNIATEYDLTKLLDYQSSLVGHKIDFTMFKKESPIDGLPIQQRDLAYQLLQQAIQAQQSGAQEVPNENTGSRE